MPTSWKRIKRRLRGATAASRKAVSSGLPVRVRHTLEPVVHYMDMLLIDHLVIRLVFPNRHKLSRDAWRSAQPLPHQVKALHNLGIRTVVNLRGNEGSTTYRLERAACRQTGLHFIDYRLRSRAAPTREEIHGLRELFSEVEHPILIHCKSGADRAGLASVLYLHIVDGIPIAEAKRELSLRYGHIRQADTGVLDYFFERYLEHSERDPIDFFAWVDQHYDPEEVRHSFRASSWANRFVNGILRRE